MIIMKYSVKLSLFLTAALLMNGCVSASLPFDPAKAVVAGGVKQATLADYAALNPGIIVAGAALYGAPNIRKAVVDMKEALEAFEEEQD